MDRGSQESLKEALIVLWVFRSWVTFASLLRGDRVEHYHRRIWREMLYKASKAISDIALDKYIRVINNRVQGGKSTKNAQQLYIMLLMSDVISVKIERGFPSPIVSYTLQCT